MVCLGRGESRNDVHDVAKGQPAGAGGEHQPVIPAKKPLEMVLVTADVVTTDQIESWRDEGYTADRRTA